MVGLVAATVIKTRFDPARYVPRDRISSRLRVKNHQMLQVRKLDSLTDL